ncbi:AAA family ATPase [Deinococcus sp.]|uniref:AAA family ATPase n=1 Tax=Deinococcus sp. TaxID=47478 RepID=UPI003CC55915
MLSSLTLQGFKSFAVLTRLEFGPGVSAVIGPNGSGKSNVVEAIRWVTHHARARELRAARAEELIFHGSGGKAALGLAEVQLELRLPSGERLNLGRRLYRDGTAEHDLGGRPARVREIQSALRGSGLGGGGLAVIGQGEVSSVVGAEGSVLLRSLQEAAGLSRSVAARQETSARLEEAASHLAEVQRLEAELAGRTRRLAAAAAAAARQRALTRELLTQTEALARAKALQARAEALALQGGVSTLGEQTAERAEAIRAAGQALEAARAAARLAHERRSAHAQALELQAAAQRSEEQARQYLEHLDSERAALTRELAALPLQAPAEPPPDLGALQTELEAATRLLQALTRQARELERRLAAARRLAAQQAQQAAARGAERRTLEGEVERLSQALAQAEDALELARRAEAEQRAARLPAASELATRTGQRNAAQASLQEREAALRAASASRAPVLRELQRLEATLSSHARYGEGARNALNSRHPGLVGSVADLLVVPAEYQNALGAALGRRLEQVVVRRADDAREIIETLKRQGGRATFLPLDLLHARPRRDAALMHERGVIGNLAELCPSEPPVIAQVLLSDTLLISDLEAASALARRHAARPRLVTLEGELLEPGGALTGGRLRDSGVGVLADTRRRSELVWELEQLDQFAANLSAEQREASGQLLALSESLERLEAQAAAHSADEQAARLARAEAEAHAGSLRSSQAALAARLARTQAAGPSPAPDDAPGPVPLEGALETLRAEIEAAAQAERQSERRLTAARGQGAEWAVYRSALLRQTELHSRLEDNGHRAREQRGQLQSRQAEVQRRSGALQGFDPQEWGRLDGERERLSSVYSALIALQNRALAQLDESRLTLARREGSLPDLPPGALPPGQPREWQAALARATAELEALGTVNPAAAQELAEETARLETLTVQRQDAQRAASELHEHLRALQESEQRATQAAYGRVAGAFADYSAELLGGQGELEREHGDDGRLSGLSLSVQPRGKRTRSLTLLSTGERTMAGLAFLFALGHAQQPESGGSGLPLAVLDEVDAPLDEANIRRFTRFLELFASRGSQFVLVTHQKATMEVAQSLWGVTTDASGASRVLSIRRAEDEARRVATPP